jgi:uncharacterized repeat protein (TIGR03803 family)
MRDKKTSRHFLFALSALAVATLLMATPAAAAPAEHTLHSFDFGGSEGVDPKGGLVFDASGNLYGTTSQGSVTGDGSVFELSPRSGGGWSEKVLHNFVASKDGSDPYASLIFDASGNLYGTTILGGAFGFGSVFEMSPKAGGGWTEKLIYSFHESNDGTLPYSALILDAAGNLYGTTRESTSGMQGTVFELSPTSSGPWTEQILHSFTGSDGANPIGGVVFDSAGNLYGTTEEGGDYGYGTVFELSPSSSGWSESVLYSFNTNGVDPIYPGAGLAIDSSGNLYGTGFDGAAYGGGAVFELKNSGGTWKESIVHAFNYSGGDGFSPQATLTLDAAGNLYGTTAFGGSGGCTSDNSVVGCGTVFKLKPSSGAWTETILHNFNNTGEDGQWPEAGVILDASGNLYGTTLFGGTYGNGAVFEIKP